MGSSNWFIAFRKQNDSYPTFIHYHCFNHQQALCGKVLHKKEMMNISMKIVCSVRARSLQRRLFLTHLEEAEVEHIDLLLHTDVRWLSRGRFLERFWELLPEIKELLKQFKDAEYAQLENEQLLLDLAFLTDLTALINELNLELQRKEKNIVDMISSVNPFKRKLQLLSTKLQRHDLRATFKTSIQNLCFRAKSLHSSIVHVTLSRCKACHQNLTSASLTLHQLNLLSSTCAFPFATDIDVDDIACKIGVLFQLNITAVKNEILFLSK